MSSNERDTQFEYFAEMQVEELMQVPGDTVGRTEEDVKQDLIKILARQAYDFAYHVLASSRGGHMEDWQVEEMLSSVPDMTELSPATSMEETLTLKPYVNIIRVEQEQEIPYGGFAADLIKALLPPDYKALGIGNFPKSECFLCSLTEPHTHSSPMEIGPEESKDSPYTTDNMRKMLPYHLDTGVPIPSQDAPIGFIEIGLGESHSFEYDQFKRLLFPENTAFTLHTHLDSSHIGFGEITSGELHFFKDNEH